MFRILIADDSAYMRESLREILRDAGHEVVGEATGGFNAVDLYKALLPDVVMLDISMPEGNGVDALRRIMQLNAEAVVIMLTVVGKPELIVEALKQGARSYLTKPFDKASVLQALKTATAGSPAADT